jgi:hypothetical protein
MTLHKMLARLIANAEAAAVADDHARREACVAVAGKVMEMIHAGNGNLKLEVAEQTA